MLFKNSVRTSKRTPHFTITKINWLTLFKFKDGRTALLDEERAGRPATACNAVNESRVEQLLLTDRRMKLK
jgi:hypothetical protein